MSSEVAESRPTITRDGASLGEVLDFNITGTAVEVLETSHYETAISTDPNITGSNTYIASQHVDPGLFNVQIHLNVDTVIKMGGDPVPFVVQHAPSGGDTTGAKQEFHGFFTGEDQNFPFKNLMMRSLNGKITGQRTVTPGSA